MIICPKCGSKSTEVQFVGPFCAKCYHFKVEIPKGLFFRQCKKCEKFLDNGEWKPYNKKRIEEIVASKFRGDFEKAHYYLDSETAVMYFNVEGSVHMVDKTFVPKFEIMICPDCSRKSGGYFEAIVQLRGDPKRVAKAAERFQNILKNKTFITKVQELKEGIDLFVGKSKFVMEMIKEMNLTYKISRKLFTQKKGKRLYRTTFVIRF